MLIVLISLITLLLPAPNLVCAETGDSSERSGPIRILPVPALGYSPETGTYLGAVVLGTLDFYNDHTRVSNAKAEWNYTWNKQLILEAEWNYFTSGEKWYTDGILHFSEYPDRYYGVGSASPDSNELLFDSRRYRAEAGILKNLGQNRFAGVDVRWLHYSHVSSEEMISFPELRNAYTTSVGLDMYHDSRLNLLNPKQGSYLRSRFSYNKGSGGAYAQFSLDGRTYIPLEGFRILAGRTFHRYNGRSVPWFDMAIAGGDEYVRGYFYGRYRDLNLSTFQTELRIPVIWRFGVAVFGGYSLLFARSIADGQSGKWNAGAGLRILMDKADDINLRLDYALGANGQQGFYIAFGESF